MSERIIVMRPGQKVAFALAGKDSTNVLYASREGGGIVFRMKGSPLARISGEGFAEKLAEPRPSDRRDTYVLEILEQGDTARLTTPEQEHRSCIYLDTGPGGIAIVGGSSLVARIEGAHLSRILDPDDPR